MNLLLDTHVLLWWLADSSRLGRKARERISDPHARVFVSAVTAWEIAHKQSVGKLSADWDVREQVAEEGFLELSIRFDHVAEAAALPRLHADPFDRILIAQARTEGLWLVTSDAAVQGYDVPWLDAQG